MSPFPLSIQRKQLKDADSLYKKVCQCMEQRQPRLLELTCDQVEEKKITVILDDVLAVQIYEKTAASGSSKRPGFTFDGT